MKKDDMLEVIRREQPELIIDATHPYAAEAGQNIREACDEAGYLGALYRLRRKSLYDSIEGCQFCNIHYFADMDEIVYYLNTNEEKVFVALGSKETAALTQVKGFKKRLYLRILPDPGALEGCINLGYQAKNIICMQGPFSKEINKAMFAETKTRILITKESGKEGGYIEKIDAARELSMITVVLARPEETIGYEPGHLQDFDQIKKLIDWTALGKSRERHKGEK
jgi:precorrin-6x reductase